MLERDRRPRGQREQSAVEQQRFVAHGETTAEARGAQAHQVHEVAHERVRLLPLVRHDEPVLLPCAVEQRDDAVVEDVDEIAARGVARPFALGDEGRVVQREHALRSRQAHEVDAHLRRPIAAQVERLDLARWERDGRMRTEPDDFFVRRAESAHGRARWAQPLQMMDGLEELERVRVVAERALERHGGQRSVFHPALGGHTRITSFRCVVRAARIEKLLIDAYKPRNRSSTVANRNAPPPVNCSSSSVMSTRVPRAKLKPCADETREYAGSLLTSTRPWICFSAAALSAKLCRRRISRIASAPPSTSER